MSLFADHAMMSPQPNTDRMRRGGKSDASERIALKIALATMPLIGLVTGVVGMALWTVH